MRSLHEVSVPDDADEWIEKNSHPYNHSALYERNNNREGEPSPNVPLPVCVWINHSVPVRRQPMTKAANAMPTTVPESRPSIRVIVEQGPLFPSAVSPALSSPAKQHETI